MFQSFDDTGGPACGSARVKALRAALSALNLDGFIVPSTDEYHNEMVPPSSQRLLWLTGFSGSWGVAVVLREKAALFVDGRYVLQAGAQVDAAVFSILKYPEAKPLEWLRENLPAAARIGYDPRLQTVNEVKAHLKAIQKAGGEFVTVRENPIDSIWTDRPATPLYPARAHGLQFAGRSAAEKAKDIQAALKTDNQDAVILTAPESLAWAFNIRGGDVQHTPLALGYAIVPADGSARIFMAPEKIGDELRAALGAVAEFLAPSALDAQLNALAKKTVRLDPDRASSWFAERLDDAGAITSEGQDPCALPRARKNEAEIAGSRAAHLRDGVAITRFLAWLDDHAPRGGIDEITAAQKLEGFRRDHDTLRDISFDTISGAGANGAIVHYRPSHSTNRTLEPGSLFLIDSGGQYLDGTTDVTRTVAIGAPTEDMRRHFTLVLKAHITLATARFPAGTKGVELDGITRRALWMAGLDYDHGTGHGVGSYLSVHEGPQSISKRGMAALEAGMIISNEPGYYREGHYGIRIENLMLVTPPAPIEGGERGMMGFEILTLAPIDARLVDAHLLSADELAWLNLYHARVREALSSALPEAEKNWLRDATQPLAATDRALP